MGQCLAQTKDGKLCKVSTKGGQRFCHLHRKQKRIKLWLSMSLVAGTAVLILGTAADITDIVSFIGIMPLSTPTATPSVVIATESTPAVVDTASPEVPVPETPDPVGFFKTRRTGPCENAFYEIPDNIDPSSDPLGFLSSFSYTQVSATWNIIVPGERSIAIDITNVESPGGRWLRISNTANVIVDSFMPLDELNMLLPSVEGIWDLGGCGGGGNHREFPPIQLDTRSSLSTTFSSADFFSLQPGEFESFAFSFECGEYGMYIFHLEVEIAAAGEAGKYAIGEPLALYCPETRFNWYVTDSPDGKYHTLYYEEELVRTLVAARPWKPCSNAGETYIFNDANRWLTVDIDPSSRLSN